MTNLQTKLLIDWELLRVQKSWLIAQPGDEAEGLINLLDAIQDQAVANGDATEAEVYNSGKLPVTAPPAAPFILFTISGGVGDLGEIKPAGSVDYDILDYDNLKESLKDGEALTLGREALAYIRKHDDADFVAEIERALRHPFELQDGSCAHCEHSAADNVHDFLTAEVKP